MAISQVCRAFLLAWDDALPPNALLRSERDRLQAKLPLTTDGTALERGRSFGILSWMIRTSIPALFNAAGVTEPAGRMSAIGSFTNSAGCTAAANQIKAGMPAPVAAAMTALGYESVGDMVAALGPEAPRHAIQSQGRGKEAIWEFVVPFVLCAENEAVCLLAAGDRPAARDAFFANVKSFRMSTAEALASSVVAAADALLDAG